MNAGAANADPRELERFDRPELDWWDPAGPMRALHALNPARFDYVRARCRLAGARALDVGCGGGLLAEELARAGAETTAIDLSTNALAQARAHAAAGGLAVDYRCEDAAAHAAARPEHYDALTCMELLEHVPEPAALLADCARLLRPGGALFLSTLNRTWRAFAEAILGAEHLLGLLPAGTHRYDRFLRPSELARALRDLGLEVRDVRGLAWNPLSGAARLRAGAAVNYLLHARRP